MFAIYAFQQGLSQRALRSAFDLALTAIILFLDNYKLPIIGIFII